MSNLEANTTISSVQLLGWAQAITGRDESSLTQTVSELGCLPIVGDVGKAEDVKRTYQVFLDRFGSLDRLVNNAGFEVVGPLVDFDEKYFGRIWETNVLGAALVAKLFIAQNQGNIINIASKLRLS
jgi:NAD(P)-dependent dehydrogenase (short-subunit alcohol dehydrogenase family)